MSKTMYMTTSFGTAIVQVEVKKETECMIWVDTDYAKMEQYNKTSDSRIFWNTWSDAREHLINRVRNKRTYLLRQVEKLDEDIDFLIAMKEEK